VLDCLRRKPYLQRTRYDVSPIQRCKAGIHNMRKVIIMDPWRFLTGKPRIVRAVIEQNDRKFQRCLRDAKTDLNQSDWQGNTVLHSAAQKNAPRYVKDLLGLVPQERIDPNKQNNEGASPLMTAVANNALDVVKLLLEEKKVNRDLRDHDGNTLLHKAVSSDSIEMVKLLFDKEISSKNAKAENKAGETALHMAVGKPELLRHLLALKNQYSDLDPMDKKGHTPLLRAVDSCDYESCEILLADKRTDPNLSKNNNDLRAKPLYVASSRSMSDGGMISHERTTWHKIFQELLNNKKIEPNNHAVMYNIVHARTEPDDDPVRLDNLKALLRKEQIDLSMEVPSQKKRTPLHIAVTGYDTVNDYVPHFEGMLYGNRGGLSSA
jgi:ankyrin repeat protein